MDNKFFISDIKSPYSILELDKRAAQAIQSHFRLSNYQMLVLSWLKGLWTGILISLIFHHFFSK